MGVYSEKSTSRGAGFDNSDVAYSAIGMENVIEAIMSADEIWIPDAGWPVNKKRR